MPLIILVGFPCSGKTTIAHELLGHLSQLMDTVLISEETLQIDKVVAYSSNFTEKNLRAHLRSEVEKSLNSNRIVILDSMNYIKGFRYELFWFVRTVETTHAIVYIEAPLELCLQRGGERYPEDLQRDLSGRMEVPNAKNRWDRPLFHLRPGEPVPLEEIQAALQSRMVTHRTPVSTEAPPNSTTGKDYVQQADAICMQVYNAIVEAQNSQPLGAQISILDTPYTLSTAYPPLLLKRAKGQFAKIIRQTPIPLEKLPEAFLDYITTSSNPQEIVKMNTWEAQLTAAIENMNEARAIEILHEGFPVNYHIHMKSTKGVIYTGHTTVLHSAVEYRLDSLARFILRKRGALEATDFEGRTPFLLAWEHGYLDFIQMLLEAGWNPHAVDFEGNTALHLSVINVHQPCAEFIVKNLGIQVSVKNGEKQTPIEMLNIVQMTWNDLDRSEKIDWLYRYLWMEQEKLRQNKLRSRFNNTTNWKRRSVHSN